MIDPRAIFNIKNRPLVASLGEPACPLSMADGIASPQRARLGADDAQARQGLRGPWTCGEYLALAIFHAAQPNKKNPDQSGSFRRLSDLGTIKNPTTGINIRVRP
jgi:hypothetical protein